MRDLTMHDLPIIEAELKREVRRYRRTKNVDKREAIAKRINFLFNVRGCALLGIKIDNVKICECDT